MFKDTDSSALRLKQGLAAFAFVMLAAFFGFWDFVCDEGWVAARGLATCVGLLFVALLILERVVSPSLGDGRRNDRQ
ncbi:hypothetical protein [Rhizobium sp. BK176]|uniref:hypothetical protein n=1 Tax=Rhizobium sp. BK176 TaxID=2587071 RepID=UPI002166EB60|nr:hypothetical protein [Rhizobium sp. BK176]MCS4088667.1 hypothetical protein [Rhizobium sp. BK176]